MSSGSTGGYACLSARKLTSAKGTCAKPFEISRTVSNLLRLTTCGPRGRWLVLFRRISLCWRMSLDQVHFAKDSRWRSRGGINDWRLLTTSHKRMNSIHPWFFIIQPCPTRKHQIVEASCAFLNERCMFYSETFRSEHDSACLGTDRYCVLWNASLPEERHPCAE